MTENYVKIGSDEIENLSIPEHVAFIMDGNGRWAQQRGLERIEGHSRGAQIVESMIRYCSDLGIRYVTLYTFSSENWKRPRKEVDFLFRTFAYYLQSKADEMIENGVRIRLCGSEKNLPEDILKITKDFEERSKDCKKIQMIFALNYGGHEEIWDGVLKFSKMILEDPEKLKKYEASSPEEFYKFLYLTDVPPVDLVIRTSGEQRISNFLLWQIAYSELYFTSVLWPDFNRDSLLEAVRSYSKRQRRFGGVDHYGR